MSPALRGPLLALTLALAGLMLPACSTTPSSTRRPTRSLPSHPEPGSRADALGPENTLVDLLAWARDHSPAVQAAAERWTAARQRIPQSSSLPDPQLQFGYFLDEVETRTGPMRWRLGVSQPLPAFGSLDLAEEVAVAESLAVGARYEAALLETAADVRQAWAELAWVNEAIRVTEGHRGLLSNWEEVARTRYSTGLAPEGDYLRAQIELATLDDRARSLRDLRQPLAARLNAALDRPTNAPLPQAELHESRPLPVDGDELLAALGATNPELIAHDHGCQAAAARIELAEAGRWPATSLGVDWTRIGKGGDDALAATLGLSLPIRRSRRDAEVAEAEAHHRALLADWQAARNRLTAELQRMLYQLRDADRRISLYRDTLLPKGQLSVQTMLVTYQGGEAGFLDLVDAERVLLEFELSHARALADRAQALAVLEALTGVDLHQEQESGS